MSFLPRTLAAVSCMTAAVFMLVLGPFRGAEAFTCGLASDTFDWTMPELQYMNRQELIEQFCLYNGYRDHILRDTILAADYHGNVVACDRLLGNIRRVLRKDHGYTDAIECEGYLPKTPAASDAPAGVETGAPVKNE